ncbi:MAG: YbaK/EbsC family protein, partial [Acidimicrobiia bacterium]|nr:YbaK/EbsC family protein [Acidimicrobiia bacterium]
GSVEESAQLQGIEADHLLKSLIVRRGTDDYLFVLMPGPRQMSWPKLRKMLGVSRVTMPSAEEARDATGYERGAITPLGAATSFPVLADASVPDGMIAIGGGAHGVNIHMSSAALFEHLSVTVADLSE